VKLPSTMNLMMRSRYQFVFLVVVWMICTIFALKYDSSIPEYIFKGEYKTAIIVCSISIFFYYVGRALDHYHLLRERFIQKDKNKKIQKEKSKNENENSVWPKETNQT